jgi:hypothetical protein
MTFSHQQIEKHEMDVEVKKGIEWWKNEREGERRKREEKEREGGGVIEKEKKK